jgi:hypothetical protein
MGIHEIGEKELWLLHELADWQHPHLAGDNHTRTLINKVYNGVHLNAIDAFDCGKYYQRMLEQLTKIKEDNPENYDGYLHAVLAFKWSIK